MNRLTLLLLFSWFLRHPLTGQVHKLVPYKRVALNAPTAVSVNQYSHLLIGDNRGSIMSFDTLGNVVHRYAPAQIAPVTLLEAWQTLRVFAFHRETQTYTLLDRFLTPVTEQVPLSGENIGFARVATLASDNQFWIFDDTDFTLKKYNPAIREVSLQVPLTLVLDAGNYQLEFMREYQNLLFLADQNSGILVFDNLGNFKRKITAKGTSFFGFAGDELYLTEGRQIRFINLYTQQERHVELPPGTSVSKTLVLGQTVILFSPREMIFCSLPLKGR